MDKGRKLKIGTRGSPLALAQAELTRQALADARPAALAVPLEATEIRVIRTTGDHILDRPLAEVGGKGLFTKEIEEALLAGEIDLAVHSMKDMPTRLPEGLVIGAMLPREDPRDALILGPELAGRCHGIAGLPQGARIGTASLRRMAQLKAARPDLVVETLRGSVGTRLGRIAEGRFAGTLLALAGLQRLGMADRASTVLGIREMLPAVAQGAIGIECRADDAWLVERLAAIGCRATAACVDAERAALAALDGSCRTPIAGLAGIDGTELLLQVLIARPDGSTVHRETGKAHVMDGVALGEALGRKLRERGGPDFFRD
ncbi:MAG TPA: hydroxymethylbilane synthase [Geminicoccaceae bacterium]|nr:hydroxymethylbilane synthase [Geminicoccaceae bacterium]